MIKEAGMILGPDAALEDVTDTRRLHFWVEWDQGQMAGAALAGKLRAYAHYTRSREWARELRPLPDLLVVTWIPHTNSVFSALPRRAPRQACWSA